MTPEKNLHLMKTLDDSWNSQDLKVFRQRHAKDCIVRWPNQPPTNGIEAHEQEALAFFKMFPDQHLVNNPYKVMFAQNNWTCTVAEFTGTMKGPMNLGYVKIVPPTNKSFKVDFCTVAHWNEDRQILEESLFYDLMGSVEANWGLDWESVRGSGTLRGWSEFSPCRAQLRAKLVRR